MEIKIIGKMDHTLDHTFESSNRVYDVKGISPAINCCGGGGLQPFILEVKHGNNKNKASNQTRLD